jgi:hypothetical protein
MIPSSKTAARLLAVETVLIAVAMLVTSASGLPILQDAIQPVSRENVLQIFLKSYVSNFPGGRETTYLSAFVDLNGDGTPEVIVYLMGPWCGSGGCTTLVLQERGSSYRVVSRITITQLPIRILHTKTRGWRDIAVRVQGGGIQPGYEALLRFDGTSYPRNPSTLPAKPLSGRPPGESAIESYESAKPLF